MGQDILCAAVSALIYGYAKEVLSVDPRRLACGEVKIGEDSGRGHIDVSCRDVKIYRRLNVALGPIEKALCAIAERYPEHVQIQT